MLTYGTRIKTSYLLPAILCEIRRKLPTLAKDILDPFDLDTWHCARRTPLSRREGPYDVTTSDDLDPAPRGGWSSSIPDTLVRPSVRRIRNNSWVYPKKEEEERTSMNSIIEPSPTLHKVKFRCDPIVIEVVGDIDDDIAHQFAQDVALAHRTGQTVLPILIQSMGGSVYSMLYMINVMKRSRIPIATIVPGMAASAAAVLFTCGTPGYRFMGSNSKVMIHSVASYMFGRIDAAEMVASATESQKLNRKICEIMSKNCGKCKSFFEEFLDKNKNTDVYLDTKDAMELGMCDRIGIPSLVTYVIPITTLQSLDGSILAGVAGDGYEEALDNASKILKGDPYGFVSKDDGRRFQASERKRRP